MCPVSVTWWSSGCDSCVPHLLAGIPLANSIQSTLHNVDPNFAVPACQALLQLFFGLKQCAALVCAPLCVALVVCFGPQLLVIISCGMIRVLERKNCECRGIAAVCVGVLDPCHPPHLRCSNSFQHDLASSTGQEEL